MLEHKKVILNSLSGDQKTSHLIPTWQDNDLQVALGQLTDFAGMLSLSTENFVITSSIPPVLHIFQNEVLVEAESDR